MCMHVPRREQNYAAMMLRVGLDKKQNAKKFRTAELNDLMRKLKIVIKLVFNENLWNIYSINYVMLYFILNFLNLFLYNVFRFHFIYLVISCLLYQN